MRGARESKDLWGISEKYLGNIEGRPRGYLQNISGIPKEYLRKDLRNTQGIPTEYQAIPKGYLRNT